jgi:hypothetical protein
MDEDKAKAGEGGSAKAPRIGAGGKPLSEEIGGPPGPEPTRYGEWEIAGRVVDF